MIKELTDEEVFGSDNLVGQTEELSDEEVFGTVEGEMSDEEVFGDIPKDPIEEYSAASKTVAESEKAFRDSYTAYTEFVGLPLTPQDEPERIRLYAEAKNAERLYGDKYNALDALRPAFEEEIAKREREEISSIESLGRDPNIAPIVPKILDLRNQRVAKQDEIYQTILDPEERTKELQNLQKSYSEDFKKVIDEVNIASTNRQNKLNEIAGVLKTYDDLQQQETQRQAIAAARTGVAPMFVPPVIDEEKEQRLDQLVSSLPEDQRDQYKKEARLILDLAENKVSHGIVNNRLQVAPAILFDEAEVNKALEESEASDVQKEAFKSSLPALQQQVADAEIGPLSQAGEFQTFIEENNLEDASNLEKITAFKNADRNWFSKLGTQSKIGLAQAHESMIGQIQATLGAGLYAYQKAGLATDPENVYKLSQAFVAASGDQQQKVEDLQILSEAIGGPTVVAELVNTGYQMAPVILPSFGLGLAMSSAGVPVRIASNIAFASAVGTSGLQSFGSTYGRATEVVKDRLIKESIDFAERQLLDKGVAPDEARKQAEQQAMSEDKAQEAAMRQAYLPAVISGLSTATVTALGGKIGPEAILKPVVLSLAKNQGYRDAVKAFLQDVTINAGGEFAEESVDQFIQGVTEALTFNPEKPLGDIMVESLYAGGMGAIFGAGGGAIEYVAKRASNRIAEDVIAKNPEMSAILEAADAAAKAAERAALVAPETSAAVGDLANQATARVARESTARQEEDQGKTIIETRTIGDAIRDKDTFVYQGMRGAITEEDGEVVFRQFGTQNKYIVPVAPEQTLAEVEELEWQRRGQRRQVTGQPIEPTVVPERAPVIERNPVVSQEELDAETDEVEVPEALVEIEKSSILNFLANLFDTGDSRAVQTEKAEFKKGKRKGQTYEREVEVPVTELPEYYRQATPEQLGQARRLIDSALRLIDTINVDEATKDRLAEHFLLLDQDITNYEQNPEYQKYRQERGWQVSTTGQAGQIPTTLTETEAAERELEQRVRAEVEARERQRERAQRVAITPPETPKGSRVRAAAYIAPDGTIYTADSHLNAMQKAADDGKITQADIAKKQKPASRETTEFGFTTDQDTFITRDQAETLARESGQILVETPETGRLHSNEVALDEFNPDIDAPPYIAKAIVNKDPISVEDVDRAGVQLPKGWVVDGDLYVYREPTAKEVKPIRKLDAFDRIYAYVQDFAEKNPQFEETLKNKVGLIVKTLNSMSVFSFPSNFQDAIIDGISNRLLSGIRRNVDPNKINANLIAKSAFSDAKKTYPQEYRRVMDSLEAERATGRKLEDILSGKISEADAELTSDEKKTLEQMRRRTAAIERKLSERKLKERIISDFEETLNDDERLAFDFVKALARLNNDPKNKSKRRQADEARQRLEDSVEEYQQLIESVTQRFAELASQLAGQELTPKAPKVRQTTNGQQVAREQEAQRNVLVEVDAELAKTENLTQAEQAARQKTEDPKINSVGSWVNTLPANSPVRRLVNLIIKANPAIANTPIQYVAAIDGKYDGFYDPANNRIVIPNTPTQDVNLLIAHEIIHGATLDKARLYDSRRFNLLTKAELNVFRELDKIRNEMIAQMTKGNKEFSAIIGNADSAQRAIDAANLVVQGKLGGELYALVNMAEFLANSINNVQFQKALDTIDPNIFRRIWNLIRKLYYGDSAPSASVGAVWDSIVALSKTTKVEADVTPAPSFVMPEAVIEGLPIVENRSDVKGLIDQAVLNKKMSPDVAVKFKAALDIIPEDGYRGSQILFANRPSRKQRNAMDMGRLISLLVSGSVSQDLKAKTPPVIYISTGRLFGQEPIKVFIHENAHIILDNVLTPELAREAREIYNSLPISRQAAFILNYAFEDIDTKFGEWFAENLVDYYEARINEAGIDIGEENISLRSFDVFIGKIYKKIVDKFSGERDRINQFFDGIDASLFRAQQEIARQAENQIAPASVALRSEYENSVKNGDYIQAKLIEEDAVSKVLNVLTPDLLKKDYVEANKTNATYGHCYSASEAIYHMLGGKASGLRPANGRDANGVVHWWLKSKDGRIIDPTATQYTSIGLNPPYEAGKGGGFLTKEPSRRAQTIIDRVNATSMGEIAPAAVAPQDARYLELAQDPETNQEELQQMVDEKAKSSGYVFGPVWHGVRSGKEFTRFFDQPTYFSESKSFATYTVAGKRGRVIKAFLRGNLFDPRNPDHRSQVKGMEELYGRLSDNPTYHYFNAAVQNWLKENGWDGHFEQESRDSKERSLVVFDPMANAKSAEAITRDDQGNIIPLSQRFDVTRPEIAFAAVRIPPEEGGNLPPVTSTKLQELGVRADETQIVGTESTYRRILEQIAKKGVTIMDWASGLGHGARLMKQMAKEIGFEALAYEPMYNPNKKGAVQEPDYNGFESVNLIPDNSLDFIINNAVLNVVDYDTRSLIVKQMYDKLKAGGTIYLQARSWRGDVQKLLNNTNNIIVGPREMFVPSKQTFQKGFDYNELSDFVETQLPDAKVERTQFGGVGIAVTKPEGIAFAAIAPKISKVSDEYDASRVGTAQQNLGVETTQDTNVSMDTIEEGELAKQMADLVIIDGTMELPKAITSIQDPVKKRDAFIGFVVDNLVALYNAFPEELRAAATRWYDGARIIAQDMSKEFGISNEQAAGILAAFSPMKEWFQNIELGIQFARLFRDHRTTKITKTKYAKGIEEVTNSASGITKAQKLQAIADRAAILAQLEGRSIDGLWKESSRYEARALKLKQTQRLTKKQYEALPEIKKAKQLRELASWAVRVIATQEYGLEYKVYTPDGGILDLARNKDGSPSTLVWQSAAFIEKALSIAHDGSAKNISNNLGKRHKIRSFYNNIIAPNSPYEDVTVDTHAVNAAILFPMGNTGKMVGDAFGDAGVGGGGNRGTYWLFREAYLRAAKKVGIQPRQMQSITWEAIRGLFPDDIKSNKSFVADITNIWKNSANARAARNKIIARGIRIPDWASAYTGGGRGVAKSLARAGGVTESKANVARGLRNRVRSGELGLAFAAVDPNLTPDPDSQDNTINEAASIAASRADAKIAQEAVIGHSVMEDEVPAEVRNAVEAAYENGMTLDEFLNIETLNLDSTYSQFAAPLWLDLNGGLMPTVKVESKKIEKFPEGTAESETVRMLKRAFDIYDASSEAIGGKELTYNVRDIVTTWLRSGLGEAALRNAIVQFTNLDPNVAIGIAEDTIKQYEIQNRIADSKLRARVRMDRALPAITIRQAAEKERMISLEEAAGTIDSIAEAIKLAYDVNVNKARTDKATEKKQIQEQLRVAKQIITTVVPRQYIAGQLTTLERAVGLEGLKKVVDAAQDALNQARLDYGVTQARKSFDKASKLVKAGTLTPEAEAVLREFVAQYTKSGMSEETKLAIEKTLEEYAKDPINALKNVANDKYLRRKGQLSAIKIDKSIGLDALQEIVRIVNATIHMDKMAKGELAFNKMMKRDEWKQAMIQEISEIKTITKEKEGFGPKLGGFKWTAIFKGARVENILRGLGLESMRKLVYEELAVGAYNDELRNRITLKNKTEAAIKEFTGLEIGTKDYDNYSKQTFEIAGLDQNGNRTKINVRRSELIDMIASLRDANNFKKAVRAGGYVIDRLRGAKGGDTIEITPESYQQIQETLNEGDLAMVNFIVGLYNNDLFNILNDSSIQAYGHGIKKSEGVYYPRNAFEWDRITDTSADLDYMEYYNSRVDSVGHLKERTDEANARLVAIDFLSRLDYHITNDSRIGAYLAIVQDINSILRDAEVMRPLETKVGRDVVFQIREMVRQQTVPLPSLREGFLNTLLGGAGIGVLGFKIHAALQNPVGIPIAMAYYGKDGYKYALKGLGFMRKGFNKTEFLNMTEVLRKYSPYYSERYGEGGFIQEFTSGMASGPSDVKWRKSIEDVSMSWMEMTDKLGALARYKTAIEVIKDRTELQEGTPEFDRAVAREWTLMMFRSENTSHGADRTGWFQLAAKQPFFKIFIMFQSAVSKQYSLFAEAVIQAQQGGRENLQEAAMKMSFVATSLYMSLAISSAFYGILFPKDEEDEEKALQNTLASLISAPLSIVPMFGNILQNTVSAWFSPENQRKPLQMDLLSSFVFGTVEALNLAAKAVRQASAEEIDTKTGDPKFWNTSFQAIEKALGLLGIPLRMPISGVFQTGKFIKQLGEKTWDGINGDLPSDAEFQEKLQKVKREMAPEPTTQEYAKLFYAVTENDQKKFNRVLKDLLQKNPNADRDSVLASIRRRPEFIVVSMVDNGTIKIGEHGITRDEYLTKRALRGSVEKATITMWRDAKDSK